MLSLPNPYPILKWQIKLLLLLLAFDQLASSGDISCIQLLAVGKESECETSAGTVPKQAHGISKVLGENQLCRMGRCAVVCCSLYFCNAYILKYMRDG